MLRESFGTDGRGNDVELFTLTNKNGTEVKISTLGATIVSFIYKDKAGVMRDVVLGYDNALDYMENAGCFGATIGRVAGRISGARMSLNGVEYVLDDNDNGNNLHSGFNGVDKKIWDVANIDETANSITLKYLSADLEQGFPGNITIKVTFTLTDEDEIRITYDAISDKDTLVNLTNHSYFNLGGHDSGYVGGQKFKVYAKNFLPLKPTGSIPTGEIRSVEGTPFDFTEFKEIGKEINADYDQLLYAGGYDHNFNLENNGKLAIMAEAVCEETGIHLYAYTDLPGVQFYVGNYIDNYKGKNGVVYKKRDGFCLESQYYPDSINNPAFESPILKAGEAYTTTTTYRLALDE